MTFKKLFDYQKNIITHEQREKGTLTSQANAAPQEILYSVAHAIPGRIRFRVPRIATDVWYADKLKAVMEFNSITDVRINREAASIVIKYRSEKISQPKMQLQLIKLIQTAPSIDIPKQATAKSVVESVFDALVNLIDSIRNVNNVRSAMKHQQSKNSTWERILSTARRMLKGLKSAILFVTPKRKTNLSNNSQEQLLTDFCSE